MRTMFLVASLLALTCTDRIRAADFDALQKRFDNRIATVLRAACLDCHSTDKAEGELDLQQFDTVAKIRQNSATWLKVIEMLETREMPPRDARQLTPEELKDLRGWLDDFVTAEADATAGDPGPVILRRLNNFEYTNSIQALTGQPLDPAREFPADSAAGEGFTNTGNSLVMSPALLSKYMNAGKQVAEHAILLPGGVRFSRFNTRRDWTDDVLSRLREFYGRYTDPSGSTRVNLQGLQWDTNAGGRLPLPTYLSVILEAREQLKTGQLTTQQLAQQHKLNAKYMATLWNALSQPQSTLLLDRLAKRFATSSTSELPQLVAEIVGWQKALTRFQSVGHMKPWLADIEPLVERQDLRVKCEATDSRSMIRLQLAAGSAGDTANDYVRWQQPRLSMAGRTDIHLRDVPLVAQHFDQQQLQLLASTEPCLRAAAKYLQTGEQKPPDLQTLSVEHGVTKESLAAWLDYLSIAPSGPARLEQLFTNPLRNTAGYAFVNGWGVPETPSIMASSGDTHVRIPGNMKPHGVVVHPAPTQNIVISWRSPIDGSVQLEGSVTHAHPECGNGVTWAVELRRGNSRQRLASGIAHGGKAIKIPDIKNLRIRQGELLSLLIGPRDGNHACDLTDVEFKLTEQSSNSPVRVWNLTADVSPNILAGNPHADQYGHSDTWNFYPEPVQAGDANRAVIPSESLLGKWLAADDDMTRGLLALQVQQLLIGPQPTQTGPDRELWDQTHAANGPLLGTMLDRIAQAARTGQLSPLGDAPAFMLFDDRDTLNRSVTGRPGDDFNAKPPQQAWNDSAWHGLDIVAVGPHVFTLNVPASLCVGRELVVGGTLDEELGVNGCVQLALRKGADVASNEPPPLTSTLPIVVPVRSTARAQLTAAANAFREVFPAALCYTKIVPVDEVVTLALFHRRIPRNSGKCFSLFSSSMAIS